MVRGHGVDQTPRHGGKRREVKNELTAGCRVQRGRLVGDRPLDEFNAILDAGEIGEFAGTHVIEDADAPVLIHEMLDKMGADEACPSRHETLPRRHAILLR
jgi:hypothetical protein